MREASVGLTSSYVSPRPSLYTGGCDMWPSHPTERDPNTKLISLCRWTEGGGILDGLNHSLRSSQVLHVDYHKLKRALDSKNVTHRYNDLRVFPPSFLPYGHSYYNCLTSVIENIINHLPKLNPYEIKKPT